MGYTDPVGDTIDDQWDSFALNEAKTYNSNPQSVCFQYVTECDTYKKMYDGISENAQSGCRRAVSTEFSVASRDEYFHNAFSSNASEVGATKKNHCYYPVATECAGTDKASCKVKSAANLIVGETQCKWTTKCVPVEKWTAECKVTQQACNKCDSACKDYITREARAGAEAASLFTMCTVCFTLAAVVWNNFITRGDNDEFTGLFSTLAYVINGGVLLVGFVMAVLCAVRMIQSDAYFGLLLCLLFLGIFLLAAGGLAVFATPSGRCCYLDCVAPSDPGSHAHTLPRAWNRVNMLRQFAGGPMLMLVAIAPVANYWCALHWSQTSKQSQCQPPCH